MKKQVTILLSALFLIFACQQESFAQKTIVQSKEKSEAEKIKQMEEQKAKAEELLNARMIDASARRAEIREIDENIDRAFIDVNSTGIAFTYPERYFEYSGGSQNSETLEFRKSVKESSFTKEVPFEIESSVRKASIAISGSCKAGEIRIKILMPGGKTYTEVLLDEYGTVNWNKSFGIEEGDSSRTGSWKFIISAKEATGNFRISIKSY